MLFQSTQPKRAATAKAGLNLFRVIISIHAAQEGCDRELKKAVIYLSNFNPRSPRGLRPAPSPRCAVILQISIHAAQEGCDPQGARVSAFVKYFNPRSPRGLRLFKPCERLNLEHFNPRSPRGLRLFPLSVLLL